MIRLVRFLYLAAICFLFCLSLHASGNLGIPFPGKIGKKGKNKLKKEPTGSFGMAASGTYNPHRSSRFCHGSAVGSWKDMDGKNDEDERPRSGDFDAVVFLKLVSNPAGLVQGYWLTVSPLALHEFDYTGAFRETDFIVDTNEKLKKGNDRVLVTFPELQDDTRKEWQEPKVLKGDATVEGLEKINRLKLVSRRSKITFEMEINASGEGYSYVHKFHGYPYQRKRGARYRKGEASGSLKCIGERQFNTLRDRFLASEEMLADE